MRAKELSKIDVAHRDSLLMGQHILNALEHFDDEWLKHFAVDPYQGQENAASLEEHVKFAKGHDFFTVTPLLFEKFKQNGGRLEVDIRLEALDLALPGNYHHLVEDVELVGQVSNVGTGTLRATVYNSPSSIVRVNDFDNAIEAEVRADWVDYSIIPEDERTNFKVITKPQIYQSRDFTGELLPNKPFVAYPETKLLRPFEYNGLAQRWIVEIAPETNPSLVFSSIDYISLKFKFSTFKNEQLAAMIKEQRKSLKRRALVRVYIWDSFFESGQSPNAAQDRIATFQLNADDFPSASRNAPMLRNIMCTFLPKTDAAPFGPIRFYVTCDQYIDAGKKAIEVPVVTSPITLTDGKPVQKASSDTENLSKPNPLNVFGDKDLTDSRVTPWIRLLTQTGAATYTGATFGLRVNLDENPGFTLEHLDYVILLLEYEYADS